MQRASVVDKHEPGQIGVEQGLGRAKHLLQRPGEAPLNVEGVQGAKASRQVRRVDRHGLKPFWVVDGARRRAWGQAARAGVGWGLGSGSGIGGTGVGAPAQVADAWVSWPGWLVGPLSQ
jgi:hypothetical protein